MDEIRICEECEWWFEGIHCPKPGCQGEVMVVRRATVTGSSRIVMEQCRLYAELYGIQPSQWRSYYFA